MNRSMLSASPPAPAAGIKAPKFKLNGLDPVPLTARPGWVPEPSVWPFEEKDAEGLELASDTALDTAVRRAEGLAPRIVLTTEPDLKMRKVGILLSKC